jgi:hypothetical protein
MNERLHAAAIAASSDPSQRSLTGLRSDHVLRALSLDLSGKWQAARAVYRILDYYVYYTSMQ